MSPTHIIPYNIKRIILKIQMVTSLVIQQSVWIIDPACICRKMNLRTFLGNLSYIIRKGERFKKRPRKISSYGKLLSHPDIYRYGCIIFIPVDSFRLPCRNGKFIYFFLLCPYLQDILFLSGTYWY